MLEAMRLSGKTLSVIAQNRFRDDMAILKKVVDSGLLGSLSYARISSAWWRGTEYYDLWWRGTWEVEGGGCTLNHAIHHIDLLLWLVGRPESVVALLTNAQHENSEVEDLSVALLRYGRALAELTSSVVHHGEHQEIVIHGRDAMVAQPWAVAAEVSSPSGFPRPGGNAELIAQIESIAEAHEPLAFTHHAGQIGDVLTALAEGREPLVTGEDGKSSVELVTAIYEAGIEGSTVDLPLGADDPYRRDGHRVAQAPHYFEKSVYASELGGDIIVGSSADN